MIRRSEERPNATSGWTISWRDVLLALGISASGTLLLGSALFLLGQNAWLFATGGVVSLFGGGVYLGKTTRSPEPLHATFVAIFYFGIVVLVLFTGTLLEALPEPLPGLGMGDSTFFFLWPLLQLAAAVLGAVVGGLQGRRRQERTKAGLGTGGEYEADNSSGG